MRSRRTFRPSSMAWVLAALSLCVARGCAVPAAPTDYACLGVECDADQTCVDGTCLPQDGAQECVTSSDCAANWTCVDGICQTDSIDDPCATLVCGESEQCVGGVCVNAVTTLCTTEADCAVGETCEGGICTAADTSDDALAQESPDIDFGNLQVGESYSLVAPSPAALLDDGSPSPDTPGDPLSEPAPSKPAPAECSCTWTVTPDTAATFSDTLDCAAELTPLLAGDLTIAVTVTCDNDADQFFQAANAQLPPTTCTSSDDCQPEELCVENVCVLRTGPLVTVLGERSRAPYVVTFDLRLEDAAGEPIDEGVSRNDFRIFEDDVEIAYDESGYSVTAAPDLPLEIVLVLDYTVSMAQSGAIETMIAAADGFIRAEHMIATHEVGVIEFHDRRDEGEGFSMVAPLTPMDEQGKQAVVAAVPPAGSVEPGLSRAWDAVNLAITKLGERERQPGGRRAIVLMTDAHDTTSTATFDSILAASKSGDINCYAVDFSNTAAADSELRQLSEETGGTYFAAAVTEALVSAFADIALDLRGQWTLNYITQKNTGSVALRIEFDWAEAANSFETNVSLAGLEGDIHQAVIDVLDREYDSTGDTTSFVLSAAYVPRNVDHFRFFVAHDTASVALLNGSGVLSGGGWTVRASGQMFDLLGTTPLDYGSFGSLAVVTVPGDSATLQITHDDSVYDSLSQAKTAVFEGEAHVEPARLVIDLEPAAGGIVLASPDQFAYAVGSTVSLTAGSLGDHVFNKWEGGATGTDATTSVVMNGDKSVTAQFHPPRNLTVAVTPASLGSVTANPNKTTYRHGDVVVLTATPAAGAAFSVWSGSVTGTSTTATLTMDGDKTVTATFVASP